MTDLETAEVGGAAGHYPSHDQTEVYVSKTANTKPSRFTLMNKPEAER